MPMSIDRRSLLLGFGALCAMPTANASEPVIIRPALKDVPTRLAEYALDGPFAYSDDVTVFNGIDARYFFFVPASSDPLRLVVFSHGALSDPTSYRNLLFHWASHGFVVAAPLHDDAILETGPTLRKNKAGEVSRWPVSELLEDPKAWKARVDRCVEAIEIAREFARIGRFDLNLERTVIAGHGYGAYIAQLVMGAEVRGAGDRLLRFRDDRFFAGICMAPQGPGIMGLTEESWKNVTSPMLHMISEGESDFTQQDWRTRALAYERAAPGYKHLALLRGGGPTLFTRTTDAIPDGGISPQLGAKAISTAFLKAYGNYDEAAFRDLSTDFFTRTSKGVVEERHR